MLIGQSNCACSECQKVCKRFAMVYGTYSSLQRTNQETFEHLSCLVTVANILKCLGCILTTYIYQDFLATTIQELA